MNEYKIQMQINRKALKQLNIALNQTVQKTRHRVETIFVWFFWAVLVICLIFGWNALDQTVMKTAWIVLAIALPISILVENDLLSLIAYLNTLPVLKKPYEVIFTEENYTVKTLAIQSIYEYHSILYICESEEYIIFVEGKKHGQVYPKSAFQSNYEEFRSFIMNRTGKQIHKL